jgi:hypothetical protein
MFCRVTRTRSGGDLRVTTLAMVRQCSEQACPRLFLTREFPHCKEPMAALRSVQRFDLDRVVMNLVILGDRDPPAPGDLRGPDPASSMAGSSG